ncbi:5-oxoprolinase subunit PxpB [Rhodococcus erythropolis]|uniref:5-oxoprolinase subunit PxpB n=1 Tax=Rhodococcus erythropolis TaxID=1833 RepID=UPI001BE91310|nr:5-oxoprolinase subunit PxpB [Rhodococcus erythropolis]MBT2263581.1 5-oxoprolinase subunit PxpB [Rhodococcus erythropolis]
MITILPAGESAVLVEYDELPSVLGNFRALDASRIPGVIDLIPAARTILIEYDNTITGHKLVEKWVRGAVPIELTADESGPAVEIPVRYDGDDLVEVGKLTGLGVDGVIDAHTAASWTVAFIGFAPGFAYLTGNERKLEVPRRSDPRRQVPAGAVGVAGPFSGVYPRSSPGGWQLIGTTELSVWDAERRPPALLLPGTTVTFVRA